MAMQAIRSGLSPCPLLVQCENFCIMAYSYSTGTGPGQVLEIGPGPMGPNILYRNVQDKEKNQDTLLPIMLV